MEKEVALTAVEIWGWNGLGARVAIFSSSWSPQSWGEVCLRWLCCQRKPMDMVMTNVSDLWGFFILYFPCSLMCLMKSSRGSTDWSANGNLISFGSTFSDSTSIYFTVPGRLGLGCCTIDMGEVSATNAKINPMHSSQLPRTNIAIGPELIIFIRKRIRESKLVMVLTVFYSAR